MRKLTPLLACFAFSQTACFGGSPATNGVYEFTTLDGEELPTQPREACCVWRAGVFVLDGEQWEMSLTLGRSPQNPGDRVRERDLEFISAKFGSFLLAGHAMELSEQFDNAPDIHLVDPTLEGDTLRLIIRQDLTWGVQEYRAVFARAASQRGRGTNDCWKGVLLSCPK